MKRTCAVLIVLTLMVVMAPAVFAEPEGELPQMVQAGFYTPSYQ